MQKACLWSWGVSLHMHVHSPCFPPLHMCTQIHTLLVPVYITAVEITEEFRSQQHVESIEVHLCNHPTILKINPWQIR